MTIVGSAPRAVNGKRGGAYNFNGSTQMIAVPATSIGNISLDNYFAGDNKSFTLSAWIKPNVNNMTNSLIFARYSPSDSQRQFVLQLSTASKLAFYRYGALDGSSYR